MLPHVTDVAAVPSAPVVAAPGLRLALPDATANVTVVPANGFPSDPSTFTMRFWNRVVPGVPVWLLPLEMEREAGTGELIVILTLSVTPDEVESVTFAVKLDVPVRVGVPLMVPAADKERPFGNAPEAIDQLYGGEPPVAESVCEYGAPTVPAAKVPAVMDKPLAGVISTKKALLAPLDLG